VLACPNGCFERGYVQRSKRIKQPWQYTCDECGTRPVSYDVGERPADPDPGTCYVDNIPWRTPEDQKEPDDDRSIACYLLACPNGCTAWPYQRRTKRIKNPWIESKYGYRTAPNFTTYEDRAESYIEKGRYRDAATIYRAMFEAMRDHLHEFDPHRGGFEHDETFQDAIASYATTIREANLPHEEKREYIEYCFDQWLDEHEEGGFP
jgi:hypothetical protein